MQMNVRSTSAATSSSTYLMALILAMAAATLNAAPTPHNGFDWRTTGCLEHSERPYNKTVVGLTQAASVEYLLDQIRCNVANTGKILPQLSTQQWVDCAGHNTPSGSLFGWALKYALKEGLEQETSYPATAKPNHCHYDKKCVAVTFDSIGGAFDGRAGKGNETALAAALRTSPIMAALEVGTAFEEYTRGVIKDCGKSGVLSVEVVGYGVTEEGEAYWSVKAPWGTKFGMDGYVQVAKDAGNACGIANEWAYPIGVKYAPPPPMC